MGRALYLPARLTGSLHPAHPDRRAGEAPAQVPRHPVGAGLAGAGESEDEVVRNLFLHRRPDSLPHPERTGQRAQGAGVVVLVVVGPTHHVSRPISSR